MRNRTPMNLFSRMFKTRLECEEWVQHQVVRHVQKISYVARVQDVDTVRNQVEILDTLGPDFKPQDGDEALSKLCRCWKQGGVYRVGIPAGEW